VVARGLVLEGCVGEVEPLVYTRFGQVALPPGVRNTEFLWYTIGRNWVAPPAFQGSGMGRGHGPWLKTTD
ncbi:MAG TPA: hypothetical protein VGU64_22910, partial [Terriglobales bacterium]|nr:hypothetical protein [Terriglobales bacterium]